MTVGSKEWHEMISAFEKLYKGERFDKENEELRTRGQLYQDGKVNALWRAFSFGYAHGRVVYMQKADKVHHKEVFI